MVITDPFHVFQTNKLNPEEPNSEGEVCVPSRRPREPNSEEEVCLSSPWLAQLVERQSAVREVEGSSPRPDQHSGS